MPIKPNLIACGFCNQSFQTFEKDKEYCNHTCEMRAQVRDSRAPWEGKLCREGIEPTWEERFSTCKHCGKRWGKERVGPNGVRLKYCDAICAMARQIHRGTKAVEKMCKECGKMFVPSSENKVCCSDVCKHSKRQKIKLKKEQIKNLEDASNPTKTRNFVGFNSLNRSAEAKRLSEDWKRLSRWK